MIVRDLKQATDLALSHYVRFAEPGPDGFPVDDARAREAAEAGDELESALWGVLMMLGCKNL